MFHVRTMNGEQLNFAVQPCAVQGQINDLVHWIRHISLFGMFLLHLCQNNTFILIT